MGSGGSSGGAVCYQSEDRGSNPIPGQVNFSLLLCVHPALKWVKIAATPLNLANWQCVDLLVKPTYRGVQAREKSSSTPCPGIANKLKVKAETIHYPFSKLTQSYHHYRDINRPPDYFA
ncbi:hypothetical protein PoB_001350500 [Plakobranchus ocellatus]|uniref:Uncharacterized protein n=1 Tax=Plakobranchus ocellatus TaxID=259542 RepID=A0AAV3YVV1_9GAST|nr:hypothetical protein PoB_001350500 [Plakobranchus ocellatus]